MSKPHLQSGMEGKARRKWSRQKRATTRGSDHHRHERNREERGEAATLPTLPPAHTRADMKSGESRGRGEGEGEGEGGETKRKEVRQRANVKRRRWVV
eukprot:CAMPEP_0113904108 /NCGR_PEP_ID=MMETSP0780_2-20120614/23002_1 /TAXON_ID=652834 /ORGANISM="Palpitomonas bilix" /LENGTH=97 /DNA_ID=CAMNT_0000897547 /DNA_START=79 /DNA_END=369 /DNA_ORIENTATION=- /assembly_acc=CAM_ASM_000599